MTLNRGFVFAITAALLFGASTPFAKALLGEANPWVLAGLLYFGSGLGLSLVYFLRFIFQRVKVESSLGRKDALPLVGAIFFGGIAGPILLMWGLALTHASTGALLLNFEGVFTASLAWFVFKEHFDRRIALGMGFIVLGGIVLSLGDQFALNTLAGPLLIMAACLSWAMDNNVTRKISESDPVQIAIIKSLVAGSTNLVIAWLYGSPFPHFSTALKAGTLGFFSYGVSLVLFVLALRHIGTSRTGAYFSMAPFVGALLSILLLKEGITYPLIGGSFLMAIGVYLHLTESHAHEHAHEELEHEHSHVHDEHHQHDHTPHDPVGESHVHFHKHKPLVHSHRHYPDIHHRHGH